MKAGAFWIKERLFVCFLSVSYVVEQNGFFFFIYDVDDAVIFLSEGPFAAEVASEWFSKPRVCFEFPYCLVYSSFCLEV